jgi:Ca2+-binding RTX toxin-like protein
LFVDNVSASNVKIIIGNGYIAIASSTNSAVLRGVTIEQLSQTNIQFFSSDLLIGDDNVSTTHDDFANLLVGGTGNDQLIGRGGRDELDGGGGNDLIYGNQGDDDINGSPGRDTVYGGQGQDAIEYTSSSESLLVYGNLENDIIYLGTGADTIYGGQGDDQIQSGNGNNLLWGNLGNDTFTGGTGNDTVYGGDGNDFIVANNGFNLIYGNLGNDTVGGVLGNGANDTVYGGKGDDLISYTNSASVALIYGNFGNDTLTGSSAADRIYGGQDSDRITGMLGADVLSGNLGNDTFVFRFASGTNDSGTSTGTADTVRDFLTNVDKIQMTIGSTVTPGTASNYNEIASASTTSVEEAAVRYATSTTVKTYTFIAGSTDGYLVLDANLDGIADSVVKLSNLNSLNSFAFSDIL